jgi:hypothetical protein
MVLSPQDESLLPNVVLSGFYDSFEERVATTFSSVFLKVNSSGSGCFSVVLDDTLFSYDMYDGGSYVEKLDGVKVDSGLSGDRLSIRGGGSFFRIIISPEFVDAGLGGCSALGDYNVGSILERKVISYSALEEMKIEYNENYDDLKIALGIPPVFDFAIISGVLSDVNMEPSYGVAEGVNVMAQNYLLEILKSDGSIVNEMFVLKVW